MCEIHKAGVEVLGISGIHVTPTMIAIAIVAFVALSLALMRVDQYGGGR